MSFCMASINFLDNSKIRHNVGILVGLPWRDKKLNTVTSHPNAAGASSALVGW